VCVCVCVVCRIYIYICIIHIYIYIYIYIYIIFTCELIHFTIQCMWNGWLHSPHTIGQSSPGILQSGQHPSNASLFRVSRLALSIFYNFRVWRLGFRPAQHPSNASLLVRMPARTHVRACVHARTQAHALRTHRRKCALATTFSCTH
jgi:hypothetical protein